MASKSLYAIIAGVGPGTGRSVALRFAQKYPVVLLARRPESYESTLKDVEDAGGKAIGISADVSDPASLKKAFDAIGKELPDNQLAAAVYNVGSGGFVKKPFLELTENDLNASLDGSIISRSFFNFAQATIPYLLEAVPNSQYPPTMILTGATASVKGSAQFSTFAAGKWGQRAMHQSLAREFGPKGVHIAHAVIDGVIDIPRTKGWAANNGVEDGKISPDAIAEAYWNLHTQHRSAFTQEIDIRPYVEKCDDQRQSLAAAITNLHCQAFKTPAFFVHVGFIENNDKKGTYYVAGKSHDATSNRIIGTVRTSAARTKEDFDTLGAKIEAAWYRALDLQQPTEKPSWNAEDELKRLIMVMFVPMITIREGGMAIPEAGQEQSWLDEQLPHVESLANKGIEDFSGLLKEIKETQG
ncbi:7-alpha-hydroxysteroid dehydrogenase [Fusarium heterosporum]|uniref:7-alpha-hydroxysteroid dehydrogenase n=1 Tax=Fusarium heterosporum TaxID=42747 RepID=A0A8H5WMU9_FUSHE|nr:7-alpha-hydroxysteroid dehydrogenase [Fusarium heterosporum]